MGDLGEGELLNVVAFVGLLVTTVLLYAAVVKYRGGVGLLSVILWFLWTHLWLGLAAVVLYEIGGPFVVTAGYVAYVLWLMNDLTKKHGADKFFTSQYGSLTWYPVTYLGGHPHYRTAGDRGVLLISQVGLVLVDRYRANASVRCIVPIDRLVRVDSVGTADRVVAWTNGLPIPMTFTTSEQGTVAIHFYNDLNCLSVMTCRVSNGQQASALKNQIDYAVYDWKRSSTVGDLQST